MWDEAVVGQCRLIPIDINDPLHNQCRLDSRGIGELVEGYYTERQGYRSNGDLHSIYVYRNHFTAAQSAASPIH